MKKCYRCKTEKDINNFHKNNDRKDGKSGICKECCKEYNKEYREKNKDKLIEYLKIYRNNNENKQHRREYQRSRIKKVLEYEKNKRKNNVIFRLKCTLRKRLHKALRGKYKNGSAIKDMGCSLQELKNHLENRFIDGMNWSNHGQWHIDHIIPLYSFDLTDREQLLKACNYKNLQPLWAKDNLSKGHKILC